LSARAQETGKIKAGLYHAEPEDAALAIQDFFEHVAVIVEKVPDRRSGDDTDEGESPTSLDADDVLTLVEDIMTTELYDRCVPTASSSRLLATP
jgi:hypothetical protein